MIEKNIHGQPNRRFYAIIPAAGRGVRMGSHINKQFLELNGVPVLARTLQAFERSNIVDGIIIVCNGEEISMIHDLCVHFSITKVIGIVVGGLTRLHSVTNALEYLDKFLAQSHTFPSETDSTVLHEDDSYNTYVLIHDGARPFVSDQVIFDCAEGVILHGACICGVPVKDTIKTVDQNGLIQTTIPRENLWAVQTPQAFDFKWIYAMHQKAISSAMDFTDDAQVAEHFGLNVYMIKGDYNNIKITTPEDLIHGEYILHNLQ